MYEKFQRQLYIQDDVWILNLFNLPISIWSFLLIIILQNNIDLLFFSCQYCFTLHLEDFQLLSMYVLIHITFCNISWPTSLESSNHGCIQLQDRTFPVSTAYKPLLSLYDHLFLFHINPIYNCYFLQLH